jgi:hypothetical protein
MGDKKVYLTQFSLARLERVDSILYSHMINTYTRSWSGAGGATFYKVTDEDAEAVRNALGYDVVLLS